MDDATRTARIRSGVLTIAAAAWLLASLLFVTVQAFHINVAATLANPALAVSMAVALVVFVIALTTLARYLFGGPEPA